MGDGAEAFTHDGPINTAPTHDLSHLLVAACSLLPWRPAGDQAGVFLAEYNAVMTEHLLDRLYRASIREIPATTVASGLLAHGEWFTTEHFTPFPTTTSEALTRWSRGMEPGRLGSLAPLFFTMKNEERRDPGYMQRTWTARFAKNDTPAGWGRLSSTAAQMIRTLRR